MRASVTGDVLCLMTPAEAESVRDRRTAEMRRRPGNMVGRRVGNSNDGVVAVRSDGGPRGRK